MVNAESRFGLYPHLDLAVFYDAGNVAAPFDDLNLHKTSYGAGVRLHTDTTTIGRMDVAYRSEGWRFVFRTSEPFRLSRGSGSRQRAVHAVARGRAMLGRTLVLGLLPITLAVNAPLGAPASRAERDAGRCDGVGVVAAADMI